MSQLTQIIAASRRRSTVLTAFSPLSLSPALWLSDTGSDPAQWDDLSGNGRHATQVTSGSRPGIIASALNGRQIRRFDGANDHMLITTGLDLAQNKTGLTFMAVVKWAGTSTAFQSLIFASNGTSPNLTRAIIGRGLISNYSGAGGRMLDANSFLGVSSSAGHPSGYHLTTAVFDYANSDLFLFTDGAAVGSNTAFQTAGSTSNTASVAIRIGVGNLGVPAEYSNCDMAEFLAFPAALSAGNRQNVERYLGAKYGISVA